MKLLLLFHCIIFFYTLFLSSFKRRDFQEKMKFKKEWSALLKGILALLIVLHHISKMIDIWLFPSNDFALSLIKQFSGSISSLFVGLFFFISGYGLTSSLMQNKEDYLRTFKKKRFMKILPPFIIASMFALILKYITTPDYDISTELYLYINKGIPWVTGWFIPILIIFYILYFIIFKNIKSTSYAISTLFLVGILLNVGIYIKGFDQYWYLSNICFPIGAIYAQYEETILLEIKNKFKDYFILSNIFIIGLFSIGATGHTRPIMFILPAFLCIIVVWYSYIYKAHNNKITIFLNEISYEIFLTHGLLLAFCDSFMRKCNIPIFLFVAALMCMSIVVAWGFKWLFSLKLKIY